MNADRIQFRAVKPGHPRGFSLVELMIVTTMTGVLVIMISGFWTSFGRSLADGVAQARTAGEATLALETLRRDLSGHLPGAAAGSQPVGQYVGRLVTDGGARLMLCFDGAPANGNADWAAPDTVVTYEMQNGQLVRLDQQTGGTFVVADRVDQFQVLDQGDRLRIDLTVTFRDFTNTYTLIAQDP
jgi:prepilin-type N-terminal cleavage/methylation domain-containing protein